MIDKIRDDLNKEFFKVLSEARHWGTKHSKPENDISGPTEAMMLKHVVDGTINVDELKEMIDKIKRTMV